MKPALLPRGRCSQKEKVTPHFAVRTINTKLGHSGGPNLTEINRKSKELILHDVVDLMRCQYPVYQNYIINSSDGRETQGIIDSDTDVEIILKI